jgi:hypothetical protein
LLDPKKAVFITRGKEFKSYKTLLQDVAGFDHHLLEEYGLESKLISAETKKHDFHAKFFTGLNERTCEVLSGSANLVRGPSIENVAFTTISPEKWERSYLDKLNVRLPPKEVPSAGFLLIHLDDEGKWTATIKSGPRLAAG